MQPLPDFRNLATIPIVRARPYALNFRLRHLVPGASLADFGLTVVLRNGRNKLIWKKPEGAGLVRTTEGWLLTLSTAETDVPVGLYVLGVEMHALGTGVPVQAAAPVHVFADLII